MHDIKMIYTWTGSNPFGELPEDIVAQINVLKAQAFEEGFLGTDFGLIDENHGYRMFSDKQKGLTYASQISSILASIGIDIIPLRYESPDGIDIITPEYTIQNP